MPSVQNATGGEASGAVADTRRMTLLLGATPDCQESLADLAMAVEIGNDEVRRCLTVCNGLPLTLFEETGTRRRGQSHLSGPCAVYCRPGKVLAA